MRKLVSNTSKPDKCPNCQEIISTEALYCEKCDYPLANPEDAENSIEREQFSIRKNKFLVENNQTIKLINKFLELPKTKQNEILDKQINFMSEDDKKNLREKFKELMAQ